MSENIYKAPEADLSLETSGDAVLASRWRRLFASILDGFTVMIVTVPIMYFTGAIEQMSKGIQPSVGYSLLVSLLGISFFIAINYKWLVNSGQTLGKKALSIKIAPLDGNSTASKKQLLKRYAAYFAFGQIPIAGPFISVINILFIFGKKKRCIHDFIASTWVINSK